MKYIRSFFAVFLIFAILTGCSTILDRLQNVETVFEIPEYNLKITADIDFERVDAGNWDLQITDGNCYISVMAYSDIDLAENQTAKDVYDFHNDDMLSRRDNAFIVKDETTETLTDKTIVKTVYSAENNGNKNYYSSYLVEFKDEETFAWVLVTGTPSYIENNSEKLDGIVHTLG